MIFQKISCFLLYSCFLIIYLPKSMHKKMKFSVKNFFRKCKQMRIKLPIYSQLLSKSLTENFIFFLSGILLVLLLSLASFSSILIASRSCNLHQSTLDTDYYTFSSSESIFSRAVNRSIVLLSGWLMLNILVISTRPGV